MVQFSQWYVTIGKTIALTIWTFVDRVMSLNTLGFVITFLPRSNRLLISWLQSLFSVILESKKRKSSSSFSTTTFFFYYYFHLFPFYLPCSNKAKCHYLKFKKIFSLKLALSCSSFTLIKMFFSSSLPSNIRVVLSAYLRLLIFLPPILISSL